MDNKFNKNIFYTNLDETTTEKHTSKDDLILSLISLILSLLFFYPYLFGSIICPIIDVINGGEVYGWHLGAVMGGILVSGPTLLSFISGILSVKKYTNCTKNKNLFRKILNIINIISLIIIGLFIILGFLFFVLLFILIF